MPRITIKDLDSRASSPHQAIDCIVGGLGGDVRILGTKIQAEGGSILPKALWSIVIKGSKIKEN